MTSMPWETLLGLPLDEALRRAQACGVEPKVVMAAAPRRNGGTESHEGGTPRVIRVHEGTLTVSAFQDGDPRKE